MLNPKGIAYLKLDQDKGIVQNAYLKYAINRFIYAPLLSSIDLWSIESTSVYEELIDRYGKIFNEKLIYLPNPIHGAQYAGENNSYLKENIILHVGRVGSYEKATDILIEAFSLGAPDNWKLVLIGPEEANSGFRKFLADFFLRKPEMRLRIMYLGNIDNREELYSWYRRSAIFALPSRFESYGLVLAEAALSACFLIASELDAAKDITNQWSFGIKVMQGDVNSLRVAIQKATAEEFAFERNERGLSQRFFAKNNFIPEVVIKKFQDKINSIS
jgi:glycosyltransferase involved in cell wall biosynthesis